MKIKTLAGLCVAFGLLAGCATHTAREPAQAGFLTRYDQLQKVDDTTWRYFDASRLRGFKEFRIQPVKVMVKSLNGKPMTVEARMAAEYVVMALIKALSDRYPIMSRSGAEVGEIRLAITHAVMEGTQLGLTLEGEILDSPSNTQAAALMKSEISGQHDLNWSYRQTFRQMVNDWAVDFRGVLDDIHSRQTAKSP